MPSDLDVRQKQRIRRRRFGAAPVSYGGYVAFDSFTRVDSASTLGSATEAGGAWTAVSGTWGIASGQAKEFTGANGKVATLGAASNGTAQVTAQPGGGTNWSNRAPGIAFRVVDASNYLTLTLGAGDVLTLNTVIAGSFVQVASGAFTLGTTSTPHIIKVVYSGTTVTGYVDGTQIIAPFTLTGGGAAIAGTGTGIRASQTAAGESLFDNYSLTSP